jgi:type VI secretion system protein ImpE
MPFAHVAAVSMQAPRRLRDLLWAPVIVRPAAGAEQLDIGEVLMPVLTPGAWRSADADVRLGRVTDVEQLVDGRSVPIGQKMLLVDGEELPILELRELTITPAD